MLTKKQQRFATEYLVDLNATQAAIRAGYSQKSAASIGEENLRKPDIQKFIQMGMEERSRRTEINADRVIQELALIAFSNMGSYAKWGADGVRLKDSDEMEDSAQRCVAEVKETTTEHGGSVTFKLHDKVSALEKLGRHLGIFKDRLELTGKDGQPLAHTVSIDKETYRRAREEILKDY